MVDLDVRFLVFGLLLLDLLMFRAGSLGVTHHITEQQRDHLHYRYVIKL